jgi:dTDP-4-amino-4,6-dideoxygalactose transaminase
MTGREALTSNRQAFEVVDAFEQAVARYTGAPYCVAVDSGCNALFLALMYYKDTRYFVTEIVLPCQTYVGVPMAVKHAGYTIQWKSMAWTGAYPLYPLPILDAAKRFTSGMYVPNWCVCVSFQASKLLPIGRGGAILHDNPYFDAWARRARNNGRAEGKLCGQETGFPVQGWNMYMPPPDAARGLWLLTDYPEYMPDQIDEYNDLSGEELFQ